jgi:tetratricopeptide (TPR) repeat protein
MTVRKQSKFILFSFILIFLLTENGSTQRATIQEEKQLIKTYPFADPDPVPSFVKNNQIYPYFRHDQFSHTAREQQWTVVRLENPYIKVFILPEVGGKIWGAIEKSTNEEFIYQNSVLKFRDIAMRGPWTSGGIELNFGIIGHTPATATPVDYVLMENSDGSVSCVVGAIDLPSRTQWRVKITLPNDKAYFETQCSWYNPTPLNQSYYHWMNAAVKASNDLQFFYPGQYHIGHGGDVHPWPIDETGRDLSFYKNNDFGGSKSYHVLGVYEEFYGGYYHDTDFGFCHWAHYDDAPGKKLWIWSLSRSGAIWEDLLTDTDGQYVEVQSGRFFSQAAGSSETPFKQAFFAPYTFDQWQEIWFPIKEIGGILDASPYGALNVARKADTLSVAICALQNLDDDLVVTVGDEQISAKHVILKPMQVFRDSLLLSSYEGTIFVTIGGNKLCYSSDATLRGKKLNRPVVASSKPDETSAEGLFIAGEELAKQRLFDQALAKYLACLEKEPYHSRALVRVAELYYRRAEYQNGLRYASKALEIDTYDADANFIYGVINRRMGNLIDAKESFGWAGRAMHYRSAAYAQMAEIYLSECDFERAIEYARRALDYNQYNLNAYYVLSICYRKQHHPTEATTILNRLLEIDPLSHFARFENYLLESNQQNLDAFTSRIRNELPNETFLELALHYVNLNLTDEAIEVLQLAPPYPIISYWLAYLHQDRSDKESVAYLTKALQSSPRLVFPFRQETLPVLEWALHKRDHWKTKYYLALLYWSRGRIEEAVDLLAQCANQPDFAAFYLARGNLFKAQNPVKVSGDFRKAIQLDTNEWRAWHALSQQYTEVSLGDQALDNSGKAYRKFPDNFILGMDYARSLLNVGKYKDCLAVLNKLNILPYEGAYEGHDLYEQANILLAVERMQQGEYEQAIQLLNDSEQWPEHLGAGKPYQPDTRLQQYLTAKCYDQLGNADRVNELLQEIVNYTNENWTNWGSNHYIGAIVLKKLGQAEKAKQLLTDWANNCPPDDVVVQWAVARFENNVSRAQQIENTVQTEQRGTPWERSRKRNLALLVKVMKALGE